MTYLMVYFIPLTSTKLHNENLMGKQGCRLYVENLFAPTENIGCDQDLTFNTCVHNTCVDSMLYGGVSCLKKLIYTLLYNYDYFLLDII